MTVGFDSDIDVIGIEGLEKLPHVVSSDIWINNSKSHAVLVSSIRNIKSGQS
ncbi:hypothetical protein [Pseudanabaena sp. 'Roaring Creek']|uniref:hypothetical protein n=1 Tax=Pseudanabaena sp. 'Roaring Creek' TaxID=1681830 RepID=UPI000AC09BB0|nr:hypothetical protein [Pseudanabaena sp. 'Roaring Creek']